ncbi:TPA: SMI1/KNR4 family protein [Streptococcus suis]|nr:SMI1/KNR4 family protein [Streptococcus suis]
MLVNVAFNQPKINFSKSDICKREKELNTHIFEIDDILEHALIIGDTVQHGFIIIWISGDENEGVYYYDDTYTLASSSDGGNTYYLASTFTEFLSLLTP